MQSSQQAYLWEDLLCLFGRITRINMTFGLAFSSALTIYYRYQAKKKTQQTD